jgi:hypothetical protein
LMKCGASCGATITRRMNTLYPKTSSHPLDRARLVSTFVEYLPRTRVGVSQGPSRENRDRPGMRDSRVRRGDKCASRGVCDLEQHSAGRDLYGPERGSISSRLLCGASEQARTRESRSEDDLHAEARDFGDWVGKHWPSAVATCALTTQSAFRCWSS